VLRAAGVKDTRVPFNLSSLASISASKLLPMVAEMGKMGNLYIGENEGLGVARFRLLLVRWAGGDQINSVRVRGTISVRVGSRKIF